MLTEEEFQYLTAKYRTPFRLPVDDTPVPLGLGARFNQQMANVPSAALEGMMGIGTGLANLVSPEQLERVRVPRPYDVAAAQTLGEHATDLIPNLLGVAPQFVLPTGLIGRGAQLLGASARMANVIGQTSGGLLGGLAESPTGAIAEGTVGAFQGLAERLPRPARALYALGAGGVGAMQALAAEQSTTGSRMGDALTFGAVNALATFASPQIAKSMRMRDIGGGRPIEGQPAPTFTSTLPGAEGIQDVAFQQMNPQQQRAYLDALMGRSGPAEQPFTGQARSGTFGRETLQATGLSPAGVAPRKFLPGTPMTSPTRARRIDTAGGDKGLMILPDQQANLSEFPQSNLSPLAPDYYPQPTQAMEGLDFSTMGTGAEFAYGRGVEPYDAFASLQQPPIIGSNELFPTRNNDSAGNLFNPQMRMSESTAGSADIYGGAPGLFDVTQGMERAPAFGPQTIFSPGEAASRAEFAAKQAASRTAAESIPPPSSSDKPLKLPHEKIPSGLSKLLGDDVGWTAPGEDLKSGGEEALALKLKTPKDIERARKAAEEYESAAKKSITAAGEEGDLDAAVEYSARQSYFLKAAELAEKRMAPPAKIAPLQEITPAIRSGDKTIKGNPGETHQDILDRLMVEDIESYVEALDTFGGPKDANHFVDAKGNAISRDQLEKAYGFRDSQRLREAQAKAPPVAVSPKKKGQLKAAAPAASAHPSYISPEFSTHTGGSRWDATRSSASIDVADEVNNASRRLHEANKTENPVKIQLATSALDRLLPKVIKQLIRDITSGDAARIRAGQSRIFHSFSPASILEKLDNMVDGNFPLLEGKVNRKSALGEGKTYTIDPSKSDRVSRLERVLKKMKAQGELDTVLGVGHNNKGEVVNYRLTEAEDMAIDRWARDVGSKFYTDYKAFYKMHENVPVKVADVEPQLAPLQKPATPADMVRVRGRFGMEDARIVGREGDTLHVEIEDPIFGKRTASVLAGDTQPVARLQPVTPTGGTVPFQGIESGRLRGSEGGRGAAQVGESEADLLGSMEEGSGPGASRKTLPGKSREVLTLLDGLKRLPTEAGAIIGEIIHRMQTAAGQSIDVSMSLRMPGAKGAMYEQSGRIALNLQWVNGIVKNWGKMSADTQSRALMRVAALFGHEVSHVAHKFAERSNLLIDGVPITRAIVERVDAMPQVQRTYVAEQILKGKGDLAPSKGVIAYLSGDIDQVYGWYKNRRPGLTREGAKELAAGEVMAEIGAMELIKRTKVDGLPDKFREAVDTFKQVMVRVIDFFRSNKQVKAVAALQDLQSIAGKMYDHLATGDTAMLSKAFPASNSWSPPPVRNPFSSGTLPTSPTNAPPVDVVSGLLRGELARLGVRAVVGGVAGGIIGPAVEPNQISTAEGILLGGVLGMFGPAVAKRLLSGSLAAEVKAAAVASKGNPIKTLAHILGGGKTLRELGAEARFGLTAEASAAAKVVRLLEREFNLNLDALMKGLTQEARGAGTLVLATVQDALDKVRWYKPSPTLLEAVDNYFQGKIDKDQFKAMLTTPELQTYGQFITTAREGMTTLTEMFASGMSKSKFRDHLIDTSDKYLGRFYSAYLEGKFNMDAFDRAKADFMAKYPDYSDHTADSIMREHMREVQANQSLFGGRRGNSGQKIDTSTTYRRLATEEEIEGQSVLVGGLEHNPYSSEYIKEKLKLDWMLEHKITDNWRDWLGEYKNPVERMMYTFQKVYPSAISAKVFDMLDNRVNSNGLKFAYTATELNSLRGVLEHGQKNVTDPAELARLQNQLKELDAYGAVPEGSAYGKLQNKWVDRFTRDEINTYATPFKWMEQPVIRSIAEFNNLIKIGRTAFNPLTVIRNYLQMPVFGLMARTNAGDVTQAWREIHRIKGADYHLMLERGIIGADFVTAELTNGPGTIFSGFMDSDIAIKAGKIAIDKILRFYQQPDTLIRAGAFISARKRFAARALEEGKFASLQDAMSATDTIDKAAAFTERYTMNYGTVPRIIKVGRQLPFINLFISYTAEITRILKNLSEDAISPGPNSAGRMHAITVLGAMAAVPAMMLAGAESNLSDKDRADWEKLKRLSPDYNRGRFRIPTHRDKAGQFHYFDITNLLPADNYSQMIKSFANGDVQGALAANPIVSLQNTPLLNMAAEQIAGEDLRTGQKIAGYGRVREILKETLPPWMPPGYEGQRLIRAFSENANGGRGLTNMKTGVQYRPSDIIANYMTGMRFGNASLATVQKSAAREAQQDIAIQQQLLRDTNSLNVPTEERARATAIYNEAVTQIMFKLHSKMGQPEPERTQR